MSKCLSKAAIICGTVLVGGLILNGCASSPGGIEPVAVSSSKYSGQSCASLRARGQRISKQALELSGKVHERSTNDAVAMGVALVLFWPAAFFVKGDGPEAEEYAKLVGERQAIETASKKKGCGIKFAPLAASNTENPRRKKDVSPLEY